jgi:hypothetical protein
MSGRRQHHIPRFIQKGFFSKKTKKQYYTWVFKINRQPYECNLINVGLEVDFYGNPSESEADNNITNSEKKFADFIQNLRTKTTNIALNSEECASLIGHMQIRAKGTRESIHEIGEAFFTGAKEKLEKIQEPEFIVKHFIKSHRKVFAERIRENLPKHLSDEQKFLQTKHFLDNPKELISTLTPSSWKQFLIHFGFFIDDLPSLVKNSHNQALERTTVAKGFFKTCRDFNWHLLYSPGTNFIFGDIGVIGKSSPDNEYKSLMFTNINLAKVYMPISDKHMIVGQKGNFDLQNEPINDLNKAIARLSREFFISSKNNNETTELSKYIGLSSKVIGDKEKLVLEEKLKEVTPN